MKAIILNSGIGKRMKPFTDSNPKCFAKVNGKTLLERQIETLIEYGIVDFIITTGPFEAKIKYLIKKRFPKIKVAYIKNPIYTSTNYIYSIYLARDIINDDVILMHGDMVFEKKLVGKLIRCKKKDCVLVNNFIKVPEKDFKGRIKNGIVSEIDVNVFGKDVFFLAPVYKLSEKTFRKWLDRICEFVNAGNTGVYAENAFNEISSKLKVFPLYYQKEACMEIDNFDDLELAQRLFKNK